MEGFELGRLSPIAFERLIRALCFANMGPAGTVYSAGADGGRDFTYEGKIKGYEAKDWNGYLIIQCKFKDQSSSKIDDITWLKTQLDEELAKFLQPGLRLRKPDYYVLATNIQLSGADGVSNRRTGKSRRGGLTKIADLFAGWKEKLQIKDFDVWPHDKIADLLIAQPEIRQTYAQWITSGDVLAKTLQHFTSIRPDFGDVAVRYIKNSLQRDQYVRLRDAGSVSDLQIRTSQVIVDLPLANGDRPYTTHFLEEEEISFEEDEEANSENAIAQLVERAREKLDAETLVADEDLGDGSARLTRNKVVLMGGPGQGKSTVSLFLTQLLRAGILSQQHNLRRDPATKRLVAEILGRAESEQISTSFPPRFPCHISLPRYADAISAARESKNRLPSILTHLATEIGNSADLEIDRSDLRNWLRSYPWMLVLDGLDEVPPSGERPAVLEAIKVFLTEVSEVNADILIVVTTRPQGYNKDLSEELWEHWQLADLKPDQALRYAQAFGQARYPDDSLRREEVHRSLEKAASQAATARLMVTPLQVTILHFIVDTGGGVPTARWTLFNEYFEVLKKREKSKGGELQRILERHSLHLGPIHYRAGLVLQTDSEHSGGAGSTFTQDRLRHLIRNYLGSEGFVDPELHHRVEELMKLATDRLVLLSQQIEGTVSFEVRSLQEFMAAAALTSGDQEIMELRLSHIAGNSHWRHVFQIAASRCFADDSFHYRRATITQIARQMDSLEPDMTAGNGARLAVDLLFDGIALDQPNFRRPLIRHALEQLDLGSTAVDDRLASVCDATASDIVREVTSRKILEGKPTSTLSAWKLLFQISQLGQSWADDIIVQFWPRVDRLDSELIEKIAFPLGSQRVADLLANAFAKDGPTSGLQSQQLSDRLLVRNKRDERIDYSRLRAMNFTSLYYGDVLDRKDCAILRDLFPSAYHTVRFVSIANANAFSKFDGRDFSTEPWRFIRGVKRFTEEPNRQTLASCIRDYQFNKGAPSIWNFLPWPISIALSEASTQDDLQRISNEIGEGKRGDVEEWIAAEKRWEKSGITQDDLYPDSRGHWLSAEIARRGIPSWVIAYDRVRATDLSLAKFLLSKAKTIKQSKIATLLKMTADIEIFFNSRKDSWTASDLEFALDRMSDPSYQFQQGFSQVLSAVPPALYSDPGTVAKMAALMVRLPNFEFHDHGVNQIILDVYKLNPTDVRLFYPVVRASAADDTSTAAAYLKQISATDIAGISDIHGRHAILAARLIYGHNKSEDLDVLLETKVPEDLLLSVLSTEHAPLDDRLRLLTLVVNKLRGKGSSDWKAYVAPMRRALDSRKSELTNLEVWTRLKLPSESFDLLLPVAGLS
ncbi:hypothetical protein [Bradyrhizobium liaoningense]|uniref:hypothetical protein n=1 Tax=Bradyrhizobium liaoningense TaxID=43992 RepID=UPI001BA8A3F9|nr:hypothetical protein [Bradyrhizobium liaoningense]MBR1167648.1 hypothetical protein [Bradyrhizobium liaoningense]